MSEPKLDWSSADVRAAELTVSLAGQTPRAWRQSFAAVVKMLGGGGDWGAVELEKRRLTVQGVQPGSEERLRFFLEGALQQANADHPAAEEPEAPGPQTDADRQREEEQDADARMTARFRSFA